MAERITVVLAEDHSLVREGVHRMLEQHADLEVIGEAADGQQALELIRRFHPDVAVLDIRMPVLNGIEVVRHIQDYSPATRALMLTAYDDEDYIVATMEAGASGYILKTAHAEELANAVRSVHLGETVIHPAIAAKVARAWAKHRSPKHELFDRLGSREQEIVHLAARGLRNKEIADKLGISIRTVEGHFTSIFSKLGVSSRVELVLYALSRHFVALEEHRDGQ